MGTAEVQVEPWGGCARNWATLREPFIRPAYEAVFDETGVESGAKLSDETNTIL